QGGVVSYGPFLSRDGTRVAFTSFDALAPGDTNGVFDAYVRDLVTGTTIGTGTFPDGSFASRDTVVRALSADGRFVAFTSADPGLVPGGTANWVDVFRKDLSTGAVELISVGMTGFPAAGGCGHPWISPDGDLVGFTSRDDSLAPGDVPDGFSDV